MKSNIKDIVKVFKLVFLQCRFCRIKIRRNECLKYLKGLEIVYSLSENKIEGMKIRYS